jgi:hypothetical protein
MREMQIYIIPEEVHVIGNDLNAISGNKYMTIGIIRQGDVRIDCRLSDRIAFLKGNV